MTTTELPSGHASTIKILADRQRKVGVPFWLPWLTRRQVIDVSIALDSLIVFVSFLIAEPIYSAISTTQLLPDANYALVGGFTTLVYYVVTRNDRVGAESIKYNQLSHILRRLLVTFAAVIVIGYALKQAQEHSRLWFVLSFVVACALLSIKTVLFQRLIKAKEISKFLAERIALYGDAAIASQTKTGLESELSGLCQISIYDGNEPKGEGLKRLLADGLDNKFSRVVLCLPSEQMDKLKDLVDAINYLPVRIEACLAHAEVQALKKNLLVDHNQILVCLDERPQDGWGIYFKRAMDFVIAAFLLILVAPVIGLAAIAIKLETSGPVFFRQRRHGWNHSIISVWKLRSMTVREDGDTIKQAVKNDPRITRVGSFLRKTSIDELPQLFNVLAGEMSLVGPRPHALAHNEMYSELITGYAARHRVKPGITGWAQIKGLRGNSEDISTMAARAEADIWYIQHWSILLDLRILLLTPFVVLFHKSAY